MNQHEWVLGCQRYYAENYYEPGNPEDGIWEDCHYPVPKCLGGTETVKLLKEHHAVQGVLQSEEYQIPCIWGWEVKYLRGDFLILGRKWQSELGKKAGRGNVGRLHTKETKQKMSQSHMGKIKTLEHRLNLSLSARGKKMSEEAKQKMAFAKKGTKLSAETKRKISESLRKRKDG